MRTIAITKDLSENEKEYVLSRVLPTDKVLFFTDEQELQASADLNEVEIILGEPDMTTIAKMPSLRWIQMSWAGANKYTGNPEALAGISLTSASGAYGFVISEYIIAGILALYRNLFTYRSTMTIGKWDRLMEEETIEGKRTLILGVGDIGTETALKIKAFGGYTVGMGRSARKTPCHFDEYHTIDSLDEELKLADIVIIALPGTSETSNMFDSSRLALLKDNCLLVNVGRGFIVDTEALICELNKGRLYGAVLDVMNPEPLPEDSPLRKMNNVLLTPHISGIGLGSNKHTRRRILDILINNLERDISGSELINIIDLKKGY